MPNGVPLLKGKSVIVTGGCSGIGWGISRRCAQMGAAVFAGQRSETGATRIETLKAAGHDAHFIRLDVSDPGSIRSFVKAVHERRGKIDILFNNAGVTIERAFFEMPLEDLDRLWATNLRSVFLMSQAVAAHMKDAGGGAIVNISSNHSTASVPGYEMYAATKGGIAAMTRAMAWSLGPYKIRVNTLSPGLTATENVQQVARDKPHLAAAFADLHATREMSTVDEIADAAIFLASDLAASITGAELIADKGLTAQLCNTDQLK
ncbi:MAG: SDR family oxidoreductase [Alphaproteobacteria bacterium]|nr:MAG: SDR family oxidoreductase [Alphaproteobacteria bacterium]